MKVLVLATQYMPTPMASDKQFVRDLVRCLPGNIECVIWTVNDWPVCETVEGIGSRTVPIYAVPRVVHGVRYTRADLARGTYTYRRHPVHGLLRNLAELCGTVLRRFRHLRSVAARERPTLVHLADNFGPVVGLIKRAAGNIPVTAAKPSVMAGQSGNGPYGVFVRACLARSDRVIAFTHACADGLAAMGIEPQRVVEIPWGVAMPAKDEAIAARTDAIRRRYRCEAGDLLVVISPQSVSSLHGGVEGLRALVEPFGLLAGRFPLRGVLAVRPDLWRPEFQSLQTDRVWVEQGPADFLDVLWASDIMFSPTFGRFDRRTATPPLTWMEAMAREAIVVTTPGRGVEELVVDGEVGCVYSRPHDLAAKMDQVVRRHDRLHEMQARARARIAEKWSAEVIAAHYGTLWHDLVGRKAGGKEAVAGGAMRRLGYAE